MNTRDVLLKRKYEMADATADTSAYQRADLQLSGVEGLVSTSQAEDPQPLPTSIPSDTEQPGVVTDSAPAIHEVVFDVGSQVVVGPVPSNDVGGLDSQRRRGGVRNFFKRILRRR